jgi:hypothetical protein
MRRYRRKDPVTPEQAKAIIYGWWCVIVSRVGGNDKHEYIFNHFRAEVQFSKLETVADVATYIRTHWGPAANRHIPLFRVWKDLLLAQWQGLEGFVYYGILKDFLHEEETAKHSAPKRPRRVRVRTP